MTKVNLNIRYCLCCCSTI